MNTGKLNTKINSIKSICYLVEEEIGEEVVLGEVVGTARAVALVLEVGDDAHIAEAVAAGGEKSVLYQTHADRTQQVLVIERRPPRLLLLLGRCASHAGGGGGGGICHLRRGQRCRSTAGCPQNLRLHH